MKTHRKTRIILIIIAALVAICSSIAIITTTANKNTANASDWTAGVGGVYGSTQGSTTGIKAGSMWWFGFEDANENSAFKAMSTVYGAGFPWNINSSTFTKTHMAGTAISRAIDSCKARHNNHQCEEPKLVALGWVQYVAGSDGKPDWCRKQACPSYNGSIALSPSPCWNTTVNNNVNLKDTVVCNLLDQHLSETVTAGVLAKDEYQRTGWYPSFKPVTVDAYTSRIKISSQPFTPCPYEYTMQAVGVDGYVKNYTTTQHTYKTAYGKFLDDVANGKYNGSYYYVGNGKNANFSNNPQEYKNNDLINDYNTSCESAWNEVDNYNIESEEKPDKTGSTVISGKEFLQRYAKGGIYKVIRGRLDGDINSKTTDVKYYKTTASYYIFDKWNECKETDKPYNTEAGQISCAYIGQSKSYADNHNPYLGKKYKITHEGWGNPLDWQWNYDTGLPTPPKAAEDEYNSIISGQNNVFLYDSGYIDENNQWHEKDDLVAKTPGDWNNYFYEFVYGFEGDTVSPQLHPVKQEYKSWNHVWHQDFMNILCDKTDFEAYKAALDKMYGDYIYTDISKVANGSKYQGQLKSPIIDSGFAEQYNKDEVKSLRDQYGLTDANTTYDTGMWFYKWNIAASQVAATMEPFDRVLYTVSTPVGSDNKLDMANAFTNIKSVVGDTSADTLLTKAKSVNSAYNTDNFIRWYNSSSYDASLDPVYTKECPYSCTSNSKGYAGGAQYNIVDGSTSDGASDNAYLLKRNVGEGSTSDYGVRVRTTDSKGNLKPSTEDVNTANMTFFRNNAWSRFRVDLWYPVLDNGLTEAKPTDSIAGISETKGSQTAKSTTIIRNNGTPWYVKGTDSSSGFATEMKAIKSIDDGESPDNAKGLLFNPETNVITPGNQISLGSVTARGANVVELPGEQTAFAIRSMWATDSNIGKLEFNIKWEFDSKNNLDVPTKFTVGNTAGSVSSTSTPQYAISDGKCYARNSYNERINDRDLINLFHDNTGAGTIDNLDKSFSDDYGKFTIQFVRATAE